ncbi:MAG: peptidyl-tRNA hydrolase [Candidatus Micrarchaeota archaeon]|nr:peptidyl-tRNA hydrolase [Candidatus Micrarchaeota archaeon]
MKQVFVVRSDLKMGKGKIAAQVAHAAIECYKKSARDDIIRWESEGSKKVVLKISGEDDLLHLRRVCSARHLKTCIIHDAGLTQVEPGSITVLGIGPADDEEIDRVTGHLKMM